MSEIAPRPITRLSESTSDSVAFDTPAGNLAGIWALRAFGFQTRTFSSVRKARPSGVSACRTSLRPSGSAPKSVPVTVIVSPGAARLGSATRRAMVTLERDRT